MTTVHLPINFALQSLVSGRVHVTRKLNLRGSLAALVEADAYPHVGIIRFEDLGPNRHYLVQGTAQRFSQTNADGTAELEVELTGPTLLLISPVI